MKNRIVNSLLILSIFFLCQCNTTQVNEQAKFRGNNQNTGQYEAFELKEPKLKWKVNLNGQVFSSPAISDDIAYVGSGDNKLYAIDIANGKTIWTFATNGAVHSSPAVENNSVYFASNDGKFYAVDKETGKEKWSFKTQGEKQYGAINLFGFQTDSVEATDPWDIYLSSPAVDDGMVYFGSGDTYIYALDIENGKLAWKYKTGNVVHSSPAIADGIVYCGSFDSKVYALDAKTGKEKWAYQCGADSLKYLMAGIQASPMVSKGVVYVGSRDANIYAIETKTGELKWKQQFGNSWMPSSVAIDDNKLHVGSSDARKYYSIDKQTGDVIDSLNTRSYTFSSPAISGNNVFIGSFNGNLYVIDKNSGKINWKFQTSASKTATGKYFTKEGKEMKALLEGITYKHHTDLGVYLNRILTLGSIASSPVVYKRSVYFTSTDGWLYAIDL